MLGSFYLRSLLEPRGNCRIDGNFPDSATIIPWTMCKQKFAVSMLSILLRSVAWIKAPRATPDHLHRASISWEREQGSFEVQGSLGDSSEVFIKRLCKMLCRSHDTQWSGSFSRQRPKRLYKLAILQWFKEQWLNERDAFPKICYL